MGAPKGENQASQCAILFPAAIHFFLKSSTQKTAAMSWTFGKQQPDEKRQQHLKQVKESIPSTAQATPASRPGKLPGILFHLLLAPNLALRAQVAMSAILAVLAAALLPKPQFDTVGGNCWCPPGWLPGHG